MIATSISREQPLLRPKHNHYTSSRIDNAATMESLRSKEIFDKTVPDPSTPEEDLGLRISAIFVILLASLLGAWFPIFASRGRERRKDSWAFFVAKYFGSGVIVATAFIHVSTLPATLRFHNLTPAF